MTQYNTLNVKLSNSQPNELKSGIKSGTEVTLNISSNVIVNSNDETNFPHRLLLTSTQGLMICKDFENGSSPNISFSKTHLPKIGRSEGFLGRFLIALLKTGLTLIKNVLKLLAKSVLIKQQHQQQTQLFKREFLDVVWQHY